jgi:hypothetical protein
MAHSKTACLHLSHKNKAVDSFMKLPVAVTGMIAHGHGDVRYVHYGLDIYPSDSLEEKCAICNWPKNDYGHIQLIYDSTAKKLH